MLKSLLSVIAGIMFALAFAHTGMAADDAIALSVTPEQVSLQPGNATQQILVVAQPHDALAGKEFTLQAICPQGITAIKPVASSPGAAAWIIDVTADERAAKDSTVVFRLDYAVQPLRADAAAPQPRAGTAVASLKVGYAPLSIAQAIKITVHHGFESLRPEQNGALVIDIENTGLAPVTLESIKPGAAGVEGVSIAPLSRPMVVPGRDLATIAATISIPKSVSPGSRPLALDFAFARGDGADIRRAVIPVIDQITLGIPGLSDLKTVLQIPSLLLMPGVLIVLTWSLLWNRRGWGRAATAEDRKFPLSAPSPEFWVVAVTLSILIDWLYPSLAGRKFDFFDRLSVTDIAALWFGSIVLVAPATYLVGALVANYIRDANAALAEAERRESNPSDRDDPATILAKLAKAGKTLRLPAYDVRAADGQGGILFDLGFGDPPTGHSWVAPAIRVASTDAGNDFSRAVEAALTASDPAALCEILAEWRDHCEVAWKQAGRVVLPAAIDAAQLADRQGVQSIIEWA